MGTYLKFFKLFESTCKILDIKYHATKDNNQSEEHLLAVCNEIGELENSIEESHNTIEMIHEAAAVAISKAPEKEDEIMEVFKPRIEFFQEKLRNKVRGCSFFKKKKDNMYMIT